METSGMLTPILISPAAASASTTEDSARVMNWGPGLGVQVGHVSERSTVTWRGTIDYGPEIMRGKEHFHVQPTDGGVPGWFCKAELTPLGLDYGISASTLPSEDLDSDGEDKDGDDDDDDGSFRGNRRTPG